MLACYRYIELHPVRARMVEEPASYRWSSCAANLGMRPHSSLNPHATWLALGATPAERSERYRTLLLESIPAAMLDEIRLSLQQQRAWGGTTSAPWSTPRPVGSLGSDQPTARPGRPCRLSEPAPVTRALLAVS